MAGIADESMLLLELGLSGSSTDEEKALVRAALSYAEGNIIKYLRYDPVQRVRTEFYPQLAASSLGVSGAWEVAGNTAYFRRTDAVSVYSLQLKHLPIRSTDSDAANSIDVRVDYDGRFGAKSGAFAVSTQKTEGSDFWPSYDGIDSNGIAFCKDGQLNSIGIWPEEPGSVKVTYVAGYTYEEFAGSDSVLDASPIQWACIREAARYVKEALIKKKSSTLGWIPGILMSERLGDYNYKISPALANTLFGGIYGLLPESKESLSEFVNYGLNL